MRLKTLTLSNFKGAKALTMKPDGQDYAIYGDNGTLKTTLFDAYSYLLFGKDSLGRKEFAIKTIEPSGEAVHNLDHEVVGHFDVNGTGVTLRKVYREVWTKKRGSADKEFTRHTVDHFIDGVPVQKGEYEDRVQGWIGEDVFKLISDPRHFCERIRWDERRKLLLAICGDISEVDVIASSAMLVDLPAILDGRKFEDVRKVMAARRAQINKELERIPTRIDEATKAMPEIDAPKSVMEGELEQLREQRRDAEAELSRLKAGGEVAEKVKALREVESGLFTLQHGASRQRDIAIGTASKARRDAINQCEQLQSEIAKDRRDMTDEADCAAKTQGRIDGLKKETEDIRAEEFEFDVDDVCFNCGQDMPADKSEEQEATAREEFNLNKAERLKDLDIIINSAASAVMRHRREIDRLEGIITAKETRLKGLEHARDAKEREIEDLEAAIDAPEPPEAAELCEEKTRLETEIAALKEGNEPAIEAAKATIGELDSQIATVEADVSKWTQRESLEIRIDQLKDQEQDLGEEYEKLEKARFVTDEFIRAQVRLMEDRINQKFDLVSFKMFNVLVNGALEECCEITVNGVPYGAGLNNGARINAGLDVISTLSQHFHVDAPVWIDNAEAVTQLLPTPGQQIRLYVSAADAELRMEVIEEE